MAVSTILVPADWTAARVFAWPAKDAASIVGRAVDFSGWLAGRVIVGSPTVTADGGAFASFAGLAGGIVSLRIGGGQTGANPQVRVTLPLSGGSTVTLAAFQPLSGSPPLPGLLPGVPDLPMGVAASAPSSYETVPAPVAHSVGSTARALASTVKVPAVWSATRVFIWPVKDPAEPAFRAVDFSDWLAAAGYAIVGSPAITASDGLRATLEDLAGGVVSLRLDGGAAAVNASVSLTVPLSGNHQVRITVAQPTTGATGTPDAAADVALPDLSGEGYLALDSTARLDQLGQLDPAGRSVLLVSENNGSRTLALAPAADLGSVLNLVAGATVSGHRAVMLDAVGNVVHADLTDPDCSVLGISLGAAMAGAAVSVAIPGHTVTEPSWSWPRNAAVFVSPDGSLTVTPPVSGVLQQIGQALSPTRLLVVSQPAFQRK